MEMLRACDTPSENNMDSKSLCKCLWPGCVLNFSWLLPQQENENYNHTLGDLFLKVLNQMKILIRNKLYKRFMDKTFLFYFGLVNFCFSLFGFLFAF